MAELVTAGPRGGIHPSSKRAAGATMISPENQEQPSGKALPSSIAAAISNAQEHLAAALPVNPYATHLQRDVCTREIEIARLCVKLPDGVNQKRACAVATIIVWDTRHEQERERLRPKLPDNSPCAGLHIQPMLYLTRELGRRDERLVRDIMADVPTAGNIPPTEGQTKRDTPSETTYKQWKMPGHHEANKS